jgi:hypothetical protein
VNDQAASALGNISPADQFWYWLAAMAITCLLGIATARAIDGWRWWRDQKRALPPKMTWPLRMRRVLLTLLPARVVTLPPERPIARRLRDAEAPTQAISMRDLTAMERVTPCPQFCDDLTSPGDPGACRCTGPCSRAWCTRRREASPVPVTWTEREEGIGHGR